MVTPHPQPRQCSEAFTMQCILVTTHRTDEGGQGLPSAQLSFAAAFRTPVVFRALSLSTAVRPSGEGALCCTDQILDILAATGWTSPATPSEPQTHGVVSLDSAPSWADASATSRATWLP